MKYSRTLPRTIVQRQEQAMRKRATAWERLVDLRSERARIEWRKKQGKKLKIYDITQLEMLDRQIEYYEKELYQR